VKVRWLSLAVTDLERLFEFIAQDNPRAAASEVEKVVSAVKTLADYPASGRPGRIPETRELVISSYLVAYRVKGDEVQVLRVLHASRKWPERI
jgi:toxin ParE1/3/4